MEFSQLEFFVTVVAEGSFSKAAERVFRTQPAVSIAVRRLEEEIGAPLFERSQKTPALTEVGELVYDYAKRILSLRDQTLEAVSELKSSERLPREVLDHNVDFALLAFQPVDSELESFPVFRDELVLIMNPEHPLAT